MYTEIYQSHGCCGDMFIVHMQCSNTFIKSNLYTCGATQYSGRIFAYWCLYTKTGIGNLYYKCWHHTKICSFWCYIFVGYAIPPSGPSYLFRARFCKISTEKSSPFDWFFFGNSQMYHLRLRCFCWCQHINSWEFWTSIVDGRKPKQPAGMDKTLGNHGTNYLSTGGECFFHQPYGLFNPLTTQVGIAPY